MADTQEEELTWFEKKLAARAKRQEGQWEIVYSPPESPDWENEWIAELGGPSKDDGPDDCKNAKDEDKGNQEEDKNIDASSPKDEDEIVWSSAKLRHWNWKPENDGLARNGFGGPRRVANYNPEPCISKFEVFQNDLKTAFEAVSPEGKPEYTSAAVFAFHMSDIDFPVVPRRDELLGILKDKYNFATETYVINAKKDSETWEPDLRHAMKLFRRKYGRPEHGKALLVVYFGGHGDNGGMERLDEMVLGGGCKVIDVPLNNLQADKIASSDVTQTDAEDYQLGWDETKDGSKEFWKAFADAPPKQNRCEICWDNFAHDWRDRASFDTLLIFDCCAAAGGGAETIAACPMGRTATTDGSESLTAYLADTLRRANGKAMTAAQLVAWSIWNRAKGSTNFIHIRAGRLGPSAILHKIKDNSKGGFITRDNCSFDSRNPQRDFGTHVVMKINIEDPESLPTLVEWERWLEQNIGPSCGVEWGWAWDSHSSITCMMVVPFEAWAYIEPRMGYSFVQRYFGMVHGKAETNKGWQHWSPITFREGGESGNNYLLQKIAAESESMATKMSKMEASMAAMQSEQKIAAESESIQTKISKMEASLAAMQLELAAAKEEQNTGKSS